MAKEMKVLVISGFLGAGKTTFIKTMVQRTGKTFCILENEYAGSKADTTVLEEEDDVKVWEMTEGCICCTMKNNFANKILNISGLLEPDYLIVEATGIGFLSKIISNIQTIEHEWIRLMQAITIVDASSVQNRSFLNDELYLDQIKNAQVLVLSKAEHWSEEERLAAEAFLRSLNEKAEIITDHYSSQPDDWWKALLLRYFDGHLASVAEDEEARWDSLTLNDITISGTARLLCLLEDLLNGCYGRIIRAKGMVKADGQWFLCDISGDRYSIRTMDAQEKSNLVFIGENIDKEAIRSQFTAIKRPIKIQITGRPYGQRPSSTALL